MEGQQQTSQVFLDTKHVENVLPLVFLMSDEVRFITVEVQAWDSDFDADDPYDISDVPGAGAVSLMFEFDRLGGTVTVSGDGTADGVLQGLQGMITVTVSPF